MPGQKIGHACWKLGFSCIYRSRSILPNWQQQSSASPDLPRKNNCPRPKATIHRMRTDWSATAFLPPENTLPELRSAASNCKGCPLWRNATQTVFGSGKQSAEFLLVGEQPGDKEDIAGKPFVGQAGRILDQALRLAGIQREAVYITNAVKHFKWTLKGKRRIHQKPSAREIFAGRPWLQAEIQAVKPRAIVCLGTTAAQAVLGRPTKIL